MAFGLKTYPDKAPKTHQWKTYSSEFAELVKKQEPKKTNKDHPLYKMLKARKEDV